MILYVVLDVRRWLLGAIIVLAVLGAAAITSYAILDHFYGERYVITSTQTVIIENFGQQVSIDNIRYDVENVEYLEDAALLSWGSYPDYDKVPAPAQEEGSPADADRYGGGTGLTSVPTDAYDQAKATGEPVTVSNTTTTETKPIDALPIAAGIGIAMGIVTIAVWAGYRRRWGGATSTLLEHGLRDMTVRDVEIVGHIMERREFTIPELMKLTKTSKITVWRTVRKLVERGLVRLTERTKLAANGLGGRGKPSRVYKYLSEKKESKTWGDLQSGEKVSKLK